LGAGSRFQRAGERGWGSCAFSARPSAILRLACFSRPDKFPLVAETEINWPAALRGTDEEKSTAICALRGFLLNGLRLALRDRRDVSEAQLEDFAQEALLRILNRLDQFEGRSKFTTWAYAIAVNTAFAELRRKRWQDVSLETLLADGAQLGEPDIMPDGAFGGGEDRNRLIAALRRAIQERLTDKQRAAIIGELREMPFDQIVQLLGTNRNAVYKLLHDARRALKNHLAAEGISALDIRTAFAL
jgi:RNA polymerase sigma-70 factor (ECF subfamily)